MNAWVVIFCILFVTICIIGSNLTNAQTSKSKINWGEICRNPLIDSVVVEPCDTLVSPDGYFLTPEGNRVLLCLVGGGVGKLFGIPDAELNALAPVAGCASNIVASPSSPVPPPSSPVPPPSSLTPSSLPSNSSSNGTATLTVNKPSSGEAPTFVILNGASVEGNLYFFPNPAWVKKGDTIIVTNTDNLPHTVTSGTGPTDPNYGIQFDTSIIEPGATADIQTTHLGAGQYPFSCTVHPYMTGVFHVVNN